MLVMYSQNMCQPFISFKWPQEKKKYSIMINGVQNLI